MKKILFAAMAVAALLASCDKNPQAQTSAATIETEVQQTAGVDLAYVQVEAVMAQCDLYLKEGKALQEKTQKTQNSWAQKEQSLQSEMARLQEKYQKGLITTFDAQNEQRKIEQKIQNYQAAAQKEAQTLDEENFVFTNRAQDLLRRAVQAVNADRKYRMIVDAKALLDADTTLDITASILAKVNELYAADQKEKK